MSKQEFSIPKLARMCQTEADAYLLLEELRWGGKPDACPHCGGMEKLYFLTPKNGETRKTRTGSASARRVWKCGHCRKQFSVLTGTIFHGTKISIRTWLFVIFEFVSSKNSVSAQEIARKYEVTPETAWHLLHRIREAMKMEPVAGLLGGAVQVDENVDRRQPEEPPRERPARSGPQATLGRCRQRRIRQAPGRRTGPLRDSAGTRCRRPRRHRADPHPSH